MPNIGVGVRVRDINTGLAGTIIRIVVEARPWRDLLIIRLDAKDPIFGTTLSSFDTEVEVLGGKARQRPAQETRERAA